MCPLLQASAVRRSRRAGAGVFAYFAGAGVSSTPAALIRAANYCRTSAKKPLSIDEKLNTCSDKCVGLLYKH